MKNASILVRSASELTALEIVPMIASFAHVVHLFRLPNPAAPTAYPRCIGNRIGAWVGSVLLPMALFCLRFLSLGHGCKEGQRKCCSGFEVKAVVQSGDPIGRV